VLANSIDLNTRAFVRNEIDRASALVFQYSKNVKIIAFRSECSRGIIENFKRNQKKSKEIFENSGRSAVATKGEIEKMIVKVIDIL
jgi:hypothetical protein